MKIFLPPLFLVGLATMLSVSQATIVLAQGTPQVELDVSATTVAYNGSVTLEWSSKNATRCVAGGGWFGGKSVDPGDHQERVENLVKTTTFTLTCSGAGGSNTGSISVSVLPPPGGLPPEDAADLFVVTDGDSEVTYTTAVLHGTAGWKNEVPAFPITAYFRYSSSEISPIFCNDIYGTNMVATRDIRLNLSPTLKTESFYQRVSGLAPDTTYYYCAITSNRDNIVYGGQKIVKSFHTSPYQTTARTVGASGITPTNAVLRGSFSSIERVYTYFQYRKATTDGSAPWSEGLCRVQHDVPAGDSNVYGDVSCNMNEKAGIRLEPFTRYQFRIVAENFVGSETKTTYGSAVAFTTLSPKGDPEQGGTGRGPTTPAPANCPAGTFFNSTSGTCVETTTQTIPIVCEPPTVWSFPNNDCVIPRPGLLLYAYPYAITSGAASRITWSATNASSCFATWTASAETKGSQDVSPTETTSYEMLCTDLVGNEVVSKKITIQVWEKPPPPPSFCATFPTSSLCVSGSGWDQGEWTGGGWTGGGWTGGGWTGGGGWKGFCNTHPESTLCQSVPGWDPTSGNPSGLTWKKFCETHPESTLCQSAPGWDPTSGNPSGLTWKKFCETHPESTLCKPILGWDPLGTGRNGTWTGGTWKAPNGYVWVDGVWGGGEWVAGSWAPGTPGLPGNGLGDPFRGTWTSENASGTSGRWSTGSGSGSWTANPGSAGGTGTGKWIATGSGSGTWTGSGGTGTFTLEAGTISGSGTWSPFSWSRTGNPADGTWTTKDESGTEGTFTTGLGSGTWTATSGRGGIGLAIWNGSGNGTGGWESATGGGTFNNTAGSNTGTGIWAPGTETGTGSSTSFPYNGTWASSNAAGTSGTFATGLGSGTWTIVSGPGGGTGVASWTGTGSGGNWTSGNGSFGNFTVRSGNMTGTGIWTSVSSGTDGSGTDGAFSRNNGVWISTSSDGRSGTWTTGNGSGTWRINQGVSGVGGKGSATWTGNTAGTAGTWTGASGVSGTFTTTSGTASGTGTWNSHLPSSGTGGIGTTGSLYNGTWASSNAAGTSGTFATGLGSGTWTIVSGPGGGTGVASWTGTGSGGNWTSGNGSSGTFTTQSGSLNGSGTWTSQTPGGTASSANGTWLSENGGASGTFATGLGSGTWVATSGLGGRGKAVWIGSGDGTGMWVSAEGSGTFTNTSGKNAGSGIWESSSPPAKTGNENGVWQTTDGGKNGTWATGAGSGTWTATSGRGGTGTATWTGNGTSSGTWTFQNGSGTWTETNGQNISGSGTWESLSLGQKDTPPDEAIVRSREGIETVFIRQILAHPVYLATYGGGRAPTAETIGDLAHQLAIKFGYVDSDGQEIRVSLPDVAAYRLSLSGDMLTVYEYYKGVIIDIRRLNAAFKDKAGYEYYFKKQ